MIKNKPGCVVPYSFPAASAFSLPNVGRCDPHNHRNLPLISFLYIQGWPEVLYLQNKQKRLENVPVLSKEPIVPANKSTSIPALCMNLTNCMPELRIQRRSISLRGLVSLKVAVQRTVLKTLSGAHGEV